MTIITNIRTLEIYNNLLKVVTSSKHSYRRIDLVSYCIGYYGSVDSDVMDAIMQLYINDFIDE